MPIGIEWYASNRTNLLALWLIEMPHAFGAFVRVDFIDLTAHVYGQIRALGFAHIAIDALIGDHQRHVVST